MHPTCQELSPFVSLADEPARVTNSEVKGRMANASAGLPRSQQVLAAEHSGFLLEHFSQHGPAALPAEDAAAPPEVCTGSPNPPDTPVPIPDLGSIPLSADGHVSLDWNPPGSSQDNWVEVLVTGLYEDAYITVAVGAWSGLHLRMACYQF